MESFIDFAKRELGVTEDKICNVAIGSQFTEPLYPLQSKHASSVSLIGSGEPDGTWWGIIMDIEDSISYEATDGNSILESFKKTVDDYILTCKQLGFQPNTPQSNQLDLKKLILQ